MCMDREGDRHVLRGRATKAPGRDSLSHASFYRDENGVGRWNNDKRCGNYFEWAGAKIEARMEAFRPPQIGPD